MAKVKGVRDAKGMLSALSRLTKEKEMRKHMRKGARVIQQEAVLNASGADPSGELGKSIGIVDDPDEPTGVILHPRRSKQFKKGYIAHIVEYGADPHPIKPKKTGGKLAFMYKGKLVMPKEIPLHPGSPQRPFMRPAWDAKKKDAKTVIGASIKKQMTGKAKK
jgi:hypothetical protein